MRRLVVLAVLVPVLAGSARAHGSGLAASTCPPVPLSGAPTAAIDAALRSGRDVWGERLLAAPGGPTYVGASRYLGPLVVARAAGRTSLTESGAAYLPFGVPLGARGAAGGIALQLADGSAIVSRRVGGPALTVSVGPGGGERYGSCGARLSDARLADGWLPILETRYVDGAGVRYTAGVVHRARGRSGLVGYVRLSADTRAARGAARAVVRFPGGSISVPIGRSRSFTVAWPLGSKRAVLADDGAYAAARAALVALLAGPARARA